MMEKGHNRFSKIGLICGVIFLLVLAGAAVADENGYAVLIEQSPIHAGTINPGLGVHTGQVGSTMRLTALPKPGYRFLYWLGDVSNPASMSTEVQIDAPKIVVAVYERDEFELPMTEIEEKLQKGAPRGGARRTPLALGSGGGMMAMRPDYDFSPFVFDFPDLPEIENDPFPVPDDVDSDLPVPDENIPEPTTLCLLAAGSILLRLRRVSG